MRRLLAGVLTAGSLVSVVDDPAQAADLPSRIRFRPHHRHFPLTGYEAIFITVIVLGVVIIALIMRWQRARRSTTVSAAHPPVSGPYSVQRGPSPGPSPAVPTAWQQPPAPPVQQSAPRPPQPPQVLPPVPPTPGPRAYPLPQYPAPRRRQD